MSQSEVILLQNIRKLGSIGDVVKVKSGFARNFLIPNEKAMRATNENKKLVAEQKEELEKQNADAKKVAEKLGAKLSGVSVNVIRQAADDGRLYGSVNVRDIATALVEAGKDVTYKQVTLNDPIKYTGLYEARVELHSEVEKIITVNVARTETEAKEQLETGKSVAQENAKKQAQEKADANEAKADQQAEDAA